MIEGLGYDDTYLMNSFQDMQNMFLQFGKLIFSMSQYYKLVRISATWRQMEKCYFFFDLHVNLLIVGTQDAELKILHIVYGQASKQTRKLQVPQRSLGFIIGL